MQVQKILLSLLVVANVSAYAIASEAVAAVQKESVVAQSEQSVTEQSATGQSAIEKCITEECAKKDLSAFNKAYRSVETCVIRGHVIPISVVVIGCVLAWQVYKKAVATGNDFVKSTDTSVVAIREGIAKGIKIENVVATGIAGFFKDSFADASKAVRAVAKDAVGDVSEVVKDVLSRIHTSLRGSEDEAQTETQEA